MNITSSGLLRGLHRFSARIFGGKAPRIGLEISDQAARILFERKGKWELEQVALPPGTMNRGKVLNPPVLLEALKQLHLRASGGKVRRRVGVHVSLTSAPVYTQLVTIPPVSESELSAAVELNVQVSAPVALKDLAWGWQPLDHQNPPAVLAAWTDRPLVDQLVNVLADANFLPASLEPKILSLARLIRELFPGGAQGTFMIASFDEIGVTLAVLNEGQIRFQYARAWEEVQGPGGGEITYAVLEALVRREVPQVAGFYAQRGGDRISNVVLASPIFVAELTGTLGELGFTVQPLLVGNPPFPQQGYAAFGAALRGNVFTTIDQPDLSLLGGQILEWLRKELVARVAQFWTIVTPLALAILLITYGVAYTFLGRVHKGIVVTGGAGGNAALLAELTDREAKAQKFNDAITSIAMLQASIKPKSALLKDIMDKATQSGVTLSRITLTESGGASSLAGTTGGQDQLLSFKRALESDPSLSVVTLPIADVRSGPDGILFSITFQANFKPLGKATP